jgi:hypothetical protein
MCMCRKHSTDIHTQTNIYKHISSENSTNVRRTHDNFVCEHVSVSRIWAVIPVGSGHIAYARRRRRRRRRAAALVVVGPAVAVAVVEDEGKEVCGWRPGLEGIPKANS